MSHIACIIFAYRQEGTAIKQRDLKLEMQKILNSKMPETEVNELKENGYKVTNATRLTGIVIALYKKAAAGDMSAIKEVISLVGDRKETAENGVTIIDDVRDKNS
jgi:hypothetical protein